MSVVVTMVLSPLDGAAAAADGDDDVDDEDDDAVREGWKKPTPMRLLLALMAHLCPTG